LLDANVPVSLAKANPIPNLIRHRNGEMLLLVFQRARASLVSTSRMMSPLMIAITERYSDAVPLLLQEGADVNYTTPDRRTALYYACFLNQPQVVAQMIDAGASMHFSDTNSVFQ
jgi:ankyrin repeat protein